MTTVAQARRPASSGLILGRYRLDERLGSGGTADVWRGTDERLRRPVAVKLLHPHLLRDPMARRRFAREARAAAALAHPGIAAVYDVDVSPTRPAIVFELVEGETLADRLARGGPLEPLEAAAIGAQLAEALQHAHERGVVHRDVKPGNVLLDRGGRARLVDFGIARVLESEAAALTTGDAIPGTLRYLAPERLAGGEATPAADLYALGVVLYEMVAGSPPYRAISPLALAEAQRQPPPLLPDVPAPLADIWSEALAADPADRPAGAGGMADRLRAIADAARPTRASAAVVVPVAPGVSSDEPTVVVPVPEEAAWPLRGSRRRRRTGAFRALPMGGLAVAGLLVGGLIVAGLAGRFDGTAQPTFPVVLVSPGSTPNVGSTVNPTLSPEPTRKPPRGKGRGHGP